MFQKLLKIKKSFKNFKIRSKSSKTPLKTVQKLLKICRKSVKKFKIIQKSFKIV